MASRVLLALSCGLCVRVRVCGKANWWDRGRERERGCCCIPYLISCRMRSGGARAVVQKDGDPMSSDHQCPTYLTCAEGGNSALAMERLVSSSSSSLSTARSCGTRASVFLRSRGFCLGLFGGGRVKMAARLTCLWDGDGMVGRWLWASLVVGGIEMVCLS